MKTIKLSNGELALVDSGDYNMLLKFKWYGSDGYARCNMKKDGKWSSAFMHRVIMNTPKGGITDHINRNKLDNRRINLRICSNSDNLLNSSIRKNNTSGAKGVRWHKKSKKWVVEVNINYKKKHVGLFKDKIEAIKKYNEVAKKCYGEFASPNTI